MEKELSFPFLLTTFSIISPGNAQKNCIPELHQTKQNTPKHKKEASFFYHSSEVKNSI